MKLISITLLLTCNLMIGQVKSKTSLLSESKALSKLSISSLGQKFLNNVENLKEAPEEIIIYQNKSKDTVYTVQQFLDLKLKDNSFKKLTLNDTYFYYTKYGSPLAFLAPIEILAEHDIEISNNTKILDFGFGTIGHLSLLSNMGAQVSGIEVDPILEVLYNDFDPKLNLVYGMFPKDENIVSKTGNGYDLFISKNTLKKGFINPENGKKPILDFGVSDEIFLASVYKLLKPDGYLLIYNLHGSYEEDPKPWKDGRSPYEMNLYEKTGFKIIEFNADHTTFARNMGTALGWDESMNFEKDLFATYTLLQKPN